MVKAKIYRQTRKGDWMATTPDCKDLLFPGKDDRLAIGIELDVDGIRTGEKVNFPVRYDIAGNLQRKKPVATGVITREYVNFGNFDILYEYWEVYTDASRNMNLRKSRGPSDVDLGTVIEIYAIAKEGKRHAFVNDWGKAETQYPVAPLTDTQKAKVKELEFSASAARNLPALAGR